MPSSPPSAESPDSRQTRLITTQSALTVLYSFLTTANISDPFAQGVKSTPTDPAATR